MLIIERHGSDVSYDEFLVSQTDDDDEIAYLPCAEKLES